jgi:hypothetical protein
VGTARASHHFRQFKDFKTILCTAHRWRGTDRLWKIPDSLLHPAAVALSWNARHKGQRGFEPRRPRLRRAGATKAPHPALRRRGGGRGRGPTPTPLALWCSTRWGAQALMQIHSQLYNTFLTTLECFFDNCPSQPTPEATQAGSREATASDAVRHGGRGKKGGRPLQTCGPWANPTVLQQNLPGRDGAIRGGARRPQGGGGGASPTLPIANPHQTTAPKDAGT